MKQKTILICDDSIAIHESLTDYLRADGFCAVSVYDGESALKKLAETQIDLVILDIMLPRMFGTDVCREIRKTSDVPIIILSAKGDEADRIIGLELGADDYVAKPFSPRELSLRAEKLLRRSGGHGPAEELRCAELTVFPDRYEAYACGIRLNLLPKEFGLLCYLVRNTGKVITREQLLNAIWGYNYYGDVRVVDTQIKRLRQKLPTENVHFCLRTIYGVGYKLEEGTAQ